MTEEESDSDSHQATPRLTFGAPRNQSTASVRGAESKKKNEELPSGDQKSNPSEPMPLSALRCLILRNSATPLYVHTPRLATLRQFTRYLAGDESRHTLFLETLEILQSAPALESLSVRTEHFELHEHRCKTGLTPREVAQLLPCTRWPLAAIADVALINMWSKVGCPHPSRARWICRICWAHWPEHARYKIAM